MKPINIVITGGGYAGIQAAKKLSKTFRKNPDVNIILIDQNSYHGLITELHEVAAYRVEEKSVKIPIRHILQYTKVQFIQERVERVDPAKRSVEFADHSLAYDYLVVAAGSEPFSFGIPGIDEHAFTLWSLEDAVTIKKHIIDMFKIAQKEKNTEIRKELLTFVVGGGGFTGIEMAGELVQWLHSLVRQYNIPRHEAKIIVADALPSILPTLKEKLSRKAHAFLVRNGVEIMTDAAITEVTPETIRFKDGKILKSRTLIWTAGIQANRFVKSTGLKLANRSRIEVNQYLQCVDDPRVYAIGDNAYSLDQKGNGVPAFVEAALQTADVAAKNIANEIKDIKEKKEFKPEFHGVMVSIGSIYGVADIMGVSLTWIFATFMKHIVNLHYIFEVGGIESCIHYLQHHFLARARSKSVLTDELIDHVNARSRSYWLAIPRIILGFVWLLSAMDKISHGWLAAGDKLISGASLQLVGPDSPAAYVWFVEHVIYSYPLAFQTLITCTELFIAVTFITGAFTFFGAVAGIVMNINFFLSGTGQLYMLLAHLPMLAGAGRAFGCDHYIMPYLMRKVRFWQRR